VAAVSQGDYPFFAEVERYLQGVFEASMSAEVRAFAEMALCVAYLGALALEGLPCWLKDGDFSVLPPGARLDTLHTRAKYFHCLGKYESMLVTAQTGLVSCGREPGIRHTDIYLRTDCAVACKALQRDDEAERHMLHAMNIALPYGFITPFAEIIPLSGGLVEQCLTRQFPAYRKAVLEQAHYTIPNWIAFHNRFTHDNITLILSLREVAIARRVVQRV
jgi:hypothetical protein